MLNSTLTADTMYVLQWLNLVLITVALAAPAFFVSFYARADWRYTSLGRTTMHMWGGFTLILLLALVNRLIQGVGFNPPPISAGFVIRVCFSTFVFTVIAVLLWSKAWIAWLVQTNPAEIEQRDISYRRKHGMPERIDEGSRSDGIRTH